MSAPEKVVVPYEPNVGDRFQYVGVCGPDGGQFMAFVLKPWYTAILPDQSHGQNWKEDAFVVMHRFDRDGNHLNSDTRPLPKMADGQPDFEWGHDRVLEMFMELPFPRYPEPIAVKPFRYEFAGYEFGLIYHPPGVDDPGSGAGYVLLHPNDMMFHPPWDGHYSS